MQSSSITASAVIQRAGVTFEEPALLHRQSTREAIVRRSRHCFHLAENDVPITDSRRYGLNTVMPMVGVTASVNQ